MCEPPCRSRPSTICRCAHLGRLWIARSEKKFGTANRHTMNAVATIAVAFQREKWSMCLSRSLAYAITRARAADLAGFILGRLALGADVRHHLPHLHDAHAVGELDLDLVVVDHLG